MAQKKPRKKVERRIKKFSIAPPTPGLVPNDKWCYIKAAAKRLRVSINTVYNRCREHLIVYRMNGNAFEFNDVHLEDYELRCMRNG